MNLIRFLLSGAMLAANLILPSPASAEEESSEPDVEQESPQAPAASTARPRRITLGHWTMLVGIGAMVLKEDPEEEGTLGEGNSQLHLATGAMIYQDLLSGQSLSLALDSEVWATTSLNPDLDVTTVPILFGLRAQIFPTSPVRLYGTAGAGLCIIAVTTVTWELSIPWIPIPSREINEEVGVLFAYAAGGGLELGGIRSDRPLSIDYRYIVAGLGSSRGGHLLCISCGFRF